MKNIKRKAATINQDFADAVQDMINSNNTDPKIDNAMDIITTEMAEHVCDNLCKYPREIKDEDALEDICLKCKMSTHICNILNTFNRINDFDQSQSIALLKTVSVLRSELAKVKKVSDAVNHPDHYNIPGRKECINEMLDQFGIDKVMAFCELSAYKYQYRHELKGGNIDLDRAGWCLDKLEVLERVKAGGAFGND